MYTGAFDEVSNSADWQPIFEIIDEDTNAPVDISTAEIGVFISEQTDVEASQRGRLLLSATTASGKITNVDVGTFQAWFTSDDMRKLRNGYYEVSCLLTQNGLTAQLMVSGLPVVEGGRVVLPAFSAPIPPPPVTNVAPANVVPPSISGSPVVGSPLTAATGTWTGTPTPSVAYQWFADGVAIVGATSNSYTPVSGDIGKTITVTVTETNVAGSASATSGGVGPVTSATAPSNTLAPVIGGSAAVGGTLTVTNNGTWSGSLPITYTYQWNNGSDIVGATSGTYTPISGDTGLNIICKVTATNIAGSAEHDSNSLGPVVAGGPFFGAYFGTGYFGGYI